MKKNTSASGFSLVEVVAAMAIAAFCLIAIFGLLPEGVDTNRASSRQTTAACLATALATDLHATPATQSSTSLYDMALGGTTTPFFLNGDGSISTQASGSMGPVYRVSVTVTPPATGSREASTAWIRITWDAITDPTKTLPAGDYETVVALNRN